jgi:hypothetical protein
MLGKKWAWGLVIMLLGSLLLAACGDEAAEEQPGELPKTRLSFADCSKQAAAQTPKAGASVPTQPPDTNVRVNLTPGTKLFLSNTFPYALALPENWEVRENQVQGNLKADLFVIKKPTTSVAGVTIISEKPATDLDSRAWYDTKLKEFKAFNKYEYEEQTPITIGGVPAYLIAYNSPAGQPFAYPVQILQLLFAGQGRGYVMTFTASPNQAAQFCPAFARAAETFTFTGLVK